MYTVAISFIGLIWLANFAKIRWHAHEKHRMVGILVHALAISIVAYLVNPHLGRVAVIVVGLHSVNLDVKRNGIWWGKLLSGLSTWPWEIAAVGAMAYRHGYLFGAVAGVAIAMGNIYLWTVYPPKHWGETQSEKIWHQIRDFILRMKS